MFPYGGAWFRGKTRWWQGKAAGPTVLHAGLPGVPARGRGRDAFSPPADLAIQRKRAARRGRPYVLSGTDYQVVPLPVPPDPLPVRSG